MLWQSCRIVWIRLTWLVLPSQTLACVANQPQNRNSTKYKKTHTVNYVQMKTVYRRKNLCTTVTSPQKMCIHASATWPWSLDRQVAIKPTCPINTGTIHVIFSQLGRQRQTLRMCVTISQTHSSSCWVVSNSNKHRSSPSSSNPSQSSKPINKRPPTK